MVLSKKLRKALYLSLSALLVVGLGTGLGASNANAKHVQRHARTHRIYHHHAHKHAKRHGKKYYHKHSKKHYRHTKRHTRKHTHKHVSKHHIELVKVRKNVYYTPGHKTDGFDGYFKISKGYIYTNGYPKKSFNPIKITSKKQANKLFNKYYHSRAFRYGFDDATTGNMMSTKHEIGLGGTTHVNMLLATSKPYQIGYILSATGGWNADGFENEDAYQVHDNGTNAGMSKSLVQSLHDCRQNLIKYVHYGLNNPAPTKAHSYNI